MYGIYSKILRSLIFEVRCQSAKNTKIMCLENVALHGASILNYKLFGVFCANFTSSYGSQNEVKIIENTECREQDVKNMIADF